MSLAGKIDHTLLTPGATDDDIHRLVEEAIEYQFATVCVNGFHVADVVRSLAGTAVKTCGVVDFPHGGGGQAAKAAQAAALVNAGAQEIDFVAHLPYLMACDTGSAAAEFKQVVKAARAADPGVVIKVIIESARLLRDQGFGDSRIAFACLAANDSGCDFVKTSTGFHPAGGATVEAVTLMRRYAGRLGVKASDGIRSYEDAMAMIESGADRIGRSESVAIVEAEASWIAASQFARTG